jgi:hypothetical protein
MRAAGITTVGEFHYLHHADPDAADFAFDEVVLAAAARSADPHRAARGLLRDRRLRQPLAGGQRRFACTSPDSYWRQIDRLAGRLAGDGSQIARRRRPQLRAASLADLAAIHAEARRRGLPFHIHSRSSDGRSRSASPPTAGGRSSSSSKLEPGEETTAVHCTHSSRRTSVASSPAAATSASAR